MLKGENTPISTKVDAGISQTITGLSPVTLLVRRGGGGVAIWRISTQLTHTQQPRQYSSP
jgi:hypothetical protein